MKPITVALLLLAVFSMSAFAQQKAKKVDPAKKIEAAMPKPLPQSPVGEKTKSDAQDNRLKGKVKSVLQYTQQPPAAKRELYSEEHYNENGNLVREVSYTDGYPESVTVWGYIDGNRVSKTNAVEYEEGERPPSDNMVVVMDDEQDALNPDAPRDSRYGLKHTYKYDQNGRLIEKWTYQNNGEVWSRTEYIYKGNQREVSRYGRDGSRSTHGFEILDEKGNVIEEYSMIDGKIEDNTVYTYQFDAQGNWILEKAFEKKKVRGKTVLKPLWVTSRTIEYYP